MGSRGAPRASRQFGVSDARPASVGTFRVFEQANPYAIYYHNWKRHTQGATWTNLDLTSKSRRAIIETEKYKQREREYQEFQRTNAAEEEDKRRQKLHLDHIKRENQKLKFHQQKLLRVNQEKRAGLPSRPASTPGKRPPLHAMETDNVVEDNQQSIHNAEWIKHRKLVALDNMPWRDPSKSGRAAELILAKGQQMREGVIRDDQEKRLRAREIYQEFADQRRKNAEQRFDVVETPFSRRHRSSHSSSMESAAMTRPSYDRQISQRLSSLGEPVNKMPRGEIDFGHIDFKDLNVDRKSSFANRSARAARASIGDLDPLEEDDMEVLSDASSTLSAAELLMRRHALSSAQSCATAASLPPAHTPAPSTATSWWGPQSRAGSSKGKKRRSAPNLTEAQRWELQERSSYFPELAKFENRLHGVSPTFCPYMERV